MSWMKRDNRRAHDVPAWRKCLAKQRDKPASGGIDKPRFSEVKSCQRSMEALPQELAWGRRWRRGADASTSAPLSDPRLSAQARLPGQENRSVQETWTPSRRNTGGKLVKRG